MLVRKQILVIVFLWLFSGFSNRCLAQESNFQFISSLTDSLLDVATTQLSGKEASQAILRSLEETDIDWFFEGQLMEFLKRKNIAHIYFEDQVEGAPDSVNASLVFEYNVLKLDIDYNKQIENSNRLKRIAEVSFFLTIIQQATCKILVSEKF